MPTIDTLITDIQKTITNKNGWFTEELAKDYSDDLSKRLQFQLNDTREGTRKLRLSQMGPKCPRALWYSLHHPELADPLPASAEIKFAFGHMIEALTICLTKASGHEVTGEQDVLELDGVVGHRDCVIDGCVVDVKSASSLSFNKFKSPDYDKVDTFGYLDQLDGYVVASRSDPLVRVKDKGYLLVVDKQLGHMVLYEHMIREENIRERIRYYKEIANSSNPPICTCRTIPDGKAGNIKLDTKASYSAYKHCCFPMLRTFLYASGPVYLTKVVRTPDVPEVTKDGKVIARV